MSIRFISRLACLPALCLVLLVTMAAQARQAVVELEDGRQITGELVTEDNEKVILEIAGIRTTFERAKVTKVSYVKSIDEQYRERRAAIASDDLEKRYELARWLFENKAYNQARRELDDLIERFPKDNRLVPLQRMIEARQKLMEETPKPGSETPKATQPTQTSTRPPANTAAADKDKPVNFDRQEIAPRLNDEQINLIRVYEINISSRPRVTVPNDVMEDVYRNYAGREGVPVGATAQRNALGADGWRKLELLFNLRARELYSRVQVHDDPAIIQTFRSEIQNRYVMSYCAAASCHGGENAGKFFLYRFQPGSNATVYTNYYILNQYKDARGYMIDRDKPDLSYLVQYGLAREAAVTPHPEVKGWRPLAQTLEDDHPRRVISWVRSLGSGAVNYPISYQPPQLDAQGKVTNAPQPATEADAK